MQTAYNEIAKRFAATYSERLEVKNVLSKIIEAVCEDGGYADPIDLNTKSAIALQSVIPQLRKINQVYYLPLKDENSMIKTTKGRYFLNKIELIQDIICHFNSETVDYKKYMDYERNLLSAYILAKRIDEEDTLFNKQGFYANVEGVCKVLEGKSNELIDQISYYQIELAGFLLSETDITSCNIFWRQLCEIEGTLDNETLSMNSAVSLFLIHHKNGRLPKNPEAEFLTKYINGIKEDINEIKEENKKTQQLICNKYEETQKHISEECAKTQQTAEDTNKTLHVTVDKKYKTIQEQAAALVIGETRMKELRKENPELKDKNGATLIQLKNALSNYKPKPTKQG